METVFDIEGMSCEHCVRAVREALAALPGVKDLRVEVGRAVVISEGPIDRDAIASAIADEGYRVRQ